jgi:uncharacterized repeat protein (TIGR03803 family)
MGLFEGSPMRPALPCLLEGVLLCSALLFAGCGANPGQGGSAAAGLDATVSGLASGTRLVLQNNGANDLTVSTSGSYSFATALAPGAAYDVTVLTQPAGQTCSVANGTGRGMVANVSTVKVVCAANTYSLGGTVTGLLGAAQVTLLNGGVDDSVTVVGGGSGAFSFPVRVPYNGSYTVTIGTPPIGETCSVANFTASGVMASVSNVQVTCAIDSYSISGTVSGLGSGNQVTLQNNGSNPITMTADGTFSFPTPVPYGGGYAVSVGTQPVAQRCTVTSGAGSNLRAPFSGVAIACGAATASVLYAFTDTPDPSSPYAGLIQGSDGNFYGTAQYGGTAGDGAIYKVTPAGVETVLYSFTGGADGMNPSNALTQGRDGNFYGTTQVGGTAGYGTAFKLTAAGVKTVLYSFTGGTDGANPYAALIQASDGNFYGTTELGGTAASGTVFEVTPAGVETVLYSFTGGADGAQPSVALTLGSDGNFYGTTEYGGVGYGTVFEVTPAGVETVLHAFVLATDGGFPSGLIQASDGNFYGTTEFGGAGGNGTVFEVTTAGLATVLHSFGGAMDGANPVAALIQGSDGNFYGTTHDGGTAGAGTIFRVTSAGVETVVYSFAFAAGGYPSAPLIQGSDGYFYGTTLAGLTGLDGLVFQY